MKALLLRPDKAGDAIKTLPALRALRRRLDGELHVLPSKFNESLFSTEPGIKCLRPEQPVTDEYDLALLLPFDPTEAMLEQLRSVSANQRFAFGGAYPGVTGLELGEHSPEGHSETQNIVELMERAFGFRLTSQFANVSEKPVLLADDNEEALKNMGTKSGAWLGFCPLAGGADRTHQLKRWKGFIHWVVSRNAYQKYFIFGSPSEEESLRELCPSAPEALFCTPSSFRALGAHLSRLDAVIAVDSGPLHLARALEVASLGFLSGGDRDRWFPKKAGHWELPRGLIDRFPFRWEMKLKYSQWERERNQSDLAARLAPLLGD